MHNIYIATIWLSTIFIWLIDNSKSPLPTPNLWQWC